VLVTYRVATAGVETQPITSTVLQDAEIIAAGQKMEPDPEGKPSTVDVVTLLVKPNDAERVTLASAQGAVHFVLRNAGDHTMVDDKPADMAQLGGLAPAVSHAKAHKVDAPAQTAKIYSVQTVAGGKQTSEYFQ
jgi:pilus assembly protein CpaB